MKKLIVFATILVGLALLGYQIFSTPKTVNANPVDSCGQETTYEKSSDYDDFRIHFEYEEDESWDNDYREKISVTAESGYQILDVWLEVDGIDQSGWDLHFSSAITNYTHSGDEIVNARAVVKKVCASASPSTSPSVSPSVEPSNDPEESKSPEATPTDNGDICHNIDGIQTGVPEGQHLDASGLNCINFELGGAPAPAEVTSTPAVLGASTMAGTGVAEENIFNLVFALGSLLSAFGIKKSFKTTEK